MFVERVLEDSGVVIGVLVPVVVLVNRDQLLFFLDSEQDHRQESIQRLENRSTYTILLGYPKRIPQDHLQLKELLFPQVHQHGWRVEQPISDVNEFVLNAGVYHNAVTLCNQHKLVHGRLKEKLVGVVHLAPIDVKINDGGGGIHDGIVHQLLPPGFTYVSIDLHRIDCRVLVLVDGLELQDSPRGHCMIIGNVPIVENAKRKAVKVGVFNVAVNDKRSD